MSPPQAGPQDAALPPGPAQAIPGLMNGLLVVLVGIAMVATLGVLFAGLLVMARGGEASRKYSNVLMRWRVILQALAVVLLLAFFLTAD